MAIHGTTRLDTGDRFPDLQVSRLGGGTLDLPGDLEGYTAVLVYRGSWCPYCNAQLRSFQSGLDKLQAEGIGVVALSADTEAQARDVADKHDLTFPIGYGLDPAATSEVLGAFYDPEDGPNGHPYLHTAGFVVGPDGTILVSVVSSNAIGRLNWQDVLGMVQYIKAH